MKRDWLIAMVCSFAGCGGDFNDDYNLVTGLRLLGVKGEPAEVTQGGTTTLTALAVDTDGSAITIDWAACTLSQVAGSGMVNPDCVTASAYTDGGAYLVSLGSGSSVTATLPPFALSALGAPDDTGGIYLPIVLHLSNGKESLDAVHRLRISTGEAINQNPQIAGVFSTAPVMGTLEDSAPFSVSAGAAITLHASFTAASAEQYRVQAGDGGSGEQTELLDVSWFATSGAFDNGSTGDGVDTTLDLSQHPQESATSGAAIDLWVVGRDGRGGSDWAHRVLNVN